MSFPRYPAYKDSGIPWVEVIPSSWNVLPLYAIAKECDEPNHGMQENNLLSLSYGRIVQKDINSNDGLLPESFETYQIVQPNDIVLRLTDLQNDQRSLRSALVEQTGIITSAYLAVRPQEVAPRFLSHLLRAYDTTKVFYSMGGGLRQSMKFADLKRLPIVLPPKEEQPLIAAFLDHETAKIDALVAVQERLIELLKEKRQAVISHAVTKGLDPSALMKDSGVDWLGEVPAHWDVCRIKQLVTRFEQGWSPQCESFPVGSASEWGVLKVGCVNGGIFNPEENKALPPDLTPLPELSISAGDLLISRANTRELVGSAAVASADHHNLMLCDKLYRLRVDAGRCLPTFLSLFLGTEQVRGQIELAATGASSSMLNISQSTILELCLALPSMAEQQELLQAVDVSVAQLDQLVSEAVLSIELLRERRSALISAAVTGQIDVRGWVPAETAG
jgi:type I restriction enzyme, S subunit